MTKEQRAAYQREWIKKHPGYGYKYARAWKQRNRAKVLADNQEYRERNKENIKVYRESYYKNHREERLVYGRGWREKNPDYMRSYRQEHEKRFRDYYRQKCSRRRAKIFKAFVEEIDRGVVFERDSGICYLCGLPVDPNNWHLDHKIPLSKNGLHCYDNVGVTHPSCNHKKKDKIMAKSMTTSCTPPSKTHMPDGAESPLGVKRGKYYDGESPNTCDAFDGDEAVFPLAPKDYLDGAAGQK